MKKNVWLAACSFLILAGGGCGTASTGSTQPVAVRGLLDLRGWQFEKKGAVNLDGEWEFCPGRLLEPADFNAAEKREGCGYITVPGMWTRETFKGESVTGKGKATYRLKLARGADTRPKIVSLHRIVSAYKIWINGIPAGQEGSLEPSAKGNESYVFIHNIRQATCTLAAGENEIILQVANYSYPNGGIGRPLKLQDAERAALDKKLGLMINMTAAGMLLFAAIYNILLYFYRKDDKAPLYLGFFSLNWAINTLNVQFPLVACCPWYTGNPYLVDFITVLLGTTLCLMSIRSIYPDMFSQRMVRLTQMLAGGFMVPLFFVSFQTSDFLMKIFYLYMIVAITYCQYGFIKALNARKKDVILFFTGFTTFYVLVANDILYAMWILTFGHFAQFGMVILCITASIVLSRRYARALRTVEELSRDLAEKNVSLEALDRLKDQFLAATSHELRTPLHGMIGLSESMIEGVTGELPSKAIENLSLIASSGHRLANMVNDILDMAKIQEEGLSLNLRSVDLCSLSAMVIKISLPLIGGKRLGIINGISPDTPRARADEDRVRQVLYNLLGNAIKFTNEGTITLTAHVIPRGDDEENDRIAISVADTGIGIPDAHREKIFEPYRQLDGSDTRSFPGTGLGLAIAKRIVELHGGTITVASGENGGSVFTFTLPVSTETLPETRDGVIIEGMRDAAADDTPEPTDLPAAISDGVFTGNPVLLVVDDDPVNIRVLQGYFESRGCTVKTATDGITALEVLAHDDAISLVLLDIMMPLMSGYEVCRRIRESRSPEELPVIMLTAKNMMADIDAAFAAGANDYIVKPVRLSELIARVGTMLKVRNVRKTAAEGFTIHDRSKAYSITFQEIIHITSHSKNVVVHTGKGDIELPVLMKDIVDRLPTDIFVRIHKNPYHQHTVRAQHVPRALGPLPGAPP